MNNKQLAAHLGLSPNTTKKFSPEKRQQLITEAQQGINQQLAALIGELAIACYKASCRVGSSVVFDTYYGGNYSSFSVHYRANKEDKNLTFLTDCQTVLNCINLSGVISKVEALCQ
jgi:hypothetical protein